MPDSLSSSKSQMKITTCSVDKGPPDANGKSMSLLINPAELSLSRKTDYGGCVPMGDTGSGKKFSKVQPDTLDFSTVFDGTGAVPIPANIELPQDVDDQLQMLSDVVYKYDSEEHEPNVVQILWGRLMFYGRLTTFNIEYSLFRPNGVALRAKATMSFDRYKNPQETALEANKLSPDLSHAVVVKDGDTLPLLCHRIYGDSRYYVDVARFNGLHAFRALKPGLLLHFPPLG
ncbi:MAG TPA: hypothetical protein VMA74_11935 [Dyella sp.]|uniref:CIS tube protein n=1 Tax=Dyella sp. TaxID=1869338 RepID=UPI002C1F59DA|nr:hypothetical protein [Dyella sp.]HUB90425.1 hypothetical protein [Dyella sp.]